MPLSRSPGWNRTLWPETELERKERRCRLLLSVPFAVIAGGAYGYLLDRNTGSGMVPGILWGAVAFTLFFHFEHLVSPLLDGALTRLFGEASAGFGEFVFDATAGALVAWMVVDLLEAPTIASVTSIFALGAIYALVMGALFCGGGMDAALEVVFRSRGSSTPHQAGHSYAAAMAVRGETATAVAAYRSAIQADPRDPVPWFQLAKLQARELGEPRDAIRTLEDARGRARLSLAQEIFLSREIVDLWRVGVGEPRKAAPELARMAERFGDTDAGRWAREELQALKEDIMKELEPDGDPQCPNAPPR